MSEEFTKKPRNRKKLLFHTILRQMEFYLSDSNLSKDRYFSQILAEHSCIRLDEFLKCNKIKKLNCTTEDIRNAISKSELIGVTEDNKSVFRKTPIEEKENVDNCTLYVENIKPDADDETLSQIFSDFGTVTYVSIPKYQHNRVNKGFAFIEYDTEEEADRALKFFESIGCKLSSNKKPEELISIMTFEGDTENPEKAKDNNKQDGVKRKTRTVPDHVSKKIKLAQNTETKSENEDTINMKEMQDEISDVNKPQNETEEFKEQENETNDAQLKQDEMNNAIKQQVEVLDTKEQQKSEEIKKSEAEIKKHQDELKGAKKQRKKQEKRKTFIKELGMQVLSKQEWKKLRNYYLNLQWTKMKEFKEHLRKQKYDREENKEIDEQPQEQDEEVGKFKFVPGVIVKLKLTEPCTDVKKLKTELKASNPELQYVDVPLPMGSEQVYLRFATKEAAIDFCNTDFDGEKTVIEGDEEKVYWEKIENDRLVKFRKMVKKERGRDKLLKKAERESRRHMKFEENE